MLKTMKGVQECWLKRQNGDQTCYLLRYNVNVDEKISKEKKKLSRLYRYALGGLYSLSILTKRSMTLISNENVTLYIAHHAK